MFKVIYRVIFLLKNRKKTVFALIFANLFFAILVLLEPIFFKKIIDILVGYDHWNTSSMWLLVTTLIAWVIVALITILIRLWVSIFSDRMSHDEYDNYIKAFYDKVLELSMRFHLNSNSWLLVKQITKWTDGIFEVQLNFFRRILPNIFTIVILMPMVLYFNMKLWLFVVTIGIISAALTFFLATRTFDKQRKVEYLYSDLSSLYWDTFSNIAIVKSFTLEKQRQKALKNLTNKRVSIQYPILNWWWIIVSFSKIIHIIVSIWVITFWSYLYFKWEISIWEIVMFLSFTSLFLFAIDDLTWTLDTMFWRLAWIKDYFKLIDTPVEVQDAVDAKKMRKVKWNVEFKNLTFSYDNKRKVLKNINLKVKSWEKIAFVWHTGSGKTTMTNMLLRFFEPQSWKVLIDDKDISEVTQESLRKNIWLVFQDNSLFNTSIEKNIKFWKKWISRKKIKEISKKSYSDDFISKLSEWLDTLVWERWIKLSGWEKQRLAIARAFLKDAPILVLDEATSALDANTEEHLQKSFRELMKWRTTFIIAHRLSTIRDADRICVFKDGKIIEEGNYKELIKKWWHFSNLVESQIKWFID